MISLRNSDIKPNKSCANFQNGHKKHAETFQKLTYFQRITGLKASRIYFEGKSKQEKQLSARETLKVNLIDTTCISNLVLYTQGKM